MFRRLELVLENFFNYNFESIDFISLRLQRKFNFKYKEPLHFAPFPHSIWNS